MTGLAWADNVQNDVAAVDGDKLVTITAGGAASVDFRIQATGVGNDGQAGCNAGDGSPATVTMVLPDEVEAEPSSLVFTVCGNASTAQSVEFSSSEPGTYELGVQVQDAGVGTYNTSQAEFTLVVEPPPDTTPPTITRTISGTPGANGWHTSDVTVAWTVTDADSPVVIDSGCGTQTFTAETAGTTSSCSAHSAGGSAADSVALKIDKTGPSAALAPSGTAGSPGWFISDVTFTTLGSDTLSEPTTCTALQTFTAETASTSVLGSCTNAAGLMTNAAPYVLRLDKTAPVVQVLVSSGEPGDNGWYVSDVTVAASGTDPVSGPVTCSPATTSVTGETSGTTVASTCTNAAGLAAIGSTSVKIDQSGPSAALVVTAGTLGAGGWYTTPVTVETQGADDISDPTACTGPQNFTNDDDAVHVEGSCTNDAGLSVAATPIDLSIDTTAPTNVVLTAVGTPGANGWYTSDVVVTTTGTDPTSGVTCTADQSFTTETAALVVTGSCTNGAGLTTPATPLTIKIDKTAPTASLAVTSGTEGANGWYTSEVTIGATGTDSISGPVTCTPASDSLAVETVGTDVDATCTNQAGLFTDAETLTVKIDMSGPSASLAVTAGTPGDNGWYISDVTVNASGADDISGPVSCSPTSHTLSAETTGATVQSTCVNQAGLQTVGTSPTIRIDKSAPTATLTVTAGDEGASGWYTSPVTVEASGTDTVSGPVVCTPASTLLTVDTAGAAVDATCTNQAGLSTAAATVTVKIDQTDPTNLAFVGGPADGGSYFFGSVPPAPTCTATDAMSGLASCVVSGHSASTGTHVLTATARDVAGNESTSQRTYTVRPWTTAGFYQPVDMGAGVVNTVKGGSTVPLKFEVFADTELTDTAIVDRFEVLRVNCLSGATEDSIELTTTGGTSLRYGGEHFIQNWQTPRQAGACYVVSVILDDGSVIAARFKLK